MIEKDERMFNRIHAIHHEPQVQGLPQIFERKPVDVYFLDGARRPGRWRICPIVIPIVRLPKMSLTNESLPEIFKWINHHTLNVPYPLQNTSLKIDETTVYRPNHNGTHSARQVRYTQEILDLVQYRGTRNARKQMNAFSEEEKLNLMLASYLLRSGRVDESSHKSHNPDPYAIRSAMIYEEYARQLGVSGPVIEQMTLLIKNACLPKGERDAAIDNDPKAMFGYQVLTLAHELDLIRCFSQEQFDDTTKVLILRRLNYFISGRYHNSRELILNQMLDFSKSIIEATGHPRRYDGHRGDAPLFARCSTEGDYCYKQIQSVPLPTWLGDVFTEPLYPFQRHQISGAI